MKYDKKKKVIALTSLVVLVLCLAVGFAAFSTTLKINGKASVKPDEKNFKVVFANSKNGDDYSYADVKASTSPNGLNTLDGHITNEDVPTISNLHVTFTDDNQSATYNFLVANIGKYDAYLTNVVTGSKICTPGEGADSTLVREACQAIKFEVTIGSGANALTITSSQEVNGHLLKKGEYEPVKVVISYPEGGQLPDGDMDVSFGDTKLFYATQDDSSIVAEDYYEELVAKGPNYLMTQNFVERSSKYYPFGLDYSTSKINNVYVVPNLNIPVDARQSKDVSLNQDGSVMAWIVFTNPDDVYAGNDLYIGADGMVSVKDGTSLFSHFDVLETLDLKYLDTSEATTMNSMFSYTGCHSLDLSGFKTSNVTDMSYMFQKFGAQSLDLSSFDTSKVTDMSYMFDNATFYNDIGELSDLNLSSFDTSNVINMAYMFNYAIFKSIDFSGWNTEKVINMESMFQATQCGGDMNLSSFNTPSLKNASYMFTASDVKTIDLSSFVGDSLNVDYAVSLFESCFSLVSVDLSSFDFKDLTFVISSDPSFISASINFKFKDTEANRSFVSSNYDYLTNIEWIS